MDEIDNYEEVKRDLIKLFAKAGMTVKEYPNPLYQKRLVTKDTLFVHNLPRFDYGKLSFEE